MNSRTSDEAGGPIGPVYGVGVEPVRSFVRSGVLSCAPDTPVVEAAAMMVRHKCGSVVVVRDGLPVGTWTEMDALRLDFGQAGVFDGPISGVMTAPLISIDGNAPLQSAVAKLREHSIRHLVVVDEGGSMVGVVSEADVVFKLGIDSYLALRRLGSVLLRSVPTVAHDVGVGEAVRRIHVSGSDAALVAEGGELVGIVTERDVLRLVARRGDSLSIGEVATRPLVAVSIRATLLEARNILEERRFRHLAVFGENGEVLGVLSMADILATTEQGYTQHLEQILGARDRQLAAAEKRLELILQAAGEGVVGLDSAGRVTFINAAAVALIGRPESAVLGRDWRELTCFMQDDTSCCCADVYAAMMACDGPAPASLTDCFFKRGNDSTFPVEISVTPLMEGRRKGGVVLVFRDVTERKRMEDALFESEQRLRLLLVAAGEGIYGLDVEGRAMFINPAAERMLGRSSEEMIGKKLHGIIHHSKADGTPYPPEDCPIHASIQSGERREGRGEVFWRRDGSCFPVEYLATPILKGKTLVGTACVFRDVTEQLKAHDSLRQERDFTRWVIDSLPGVFCVITAEGRFELWNRSLEDISGYDAAEIGGMDVWTLFDHDEKIFAYVAVEAEIFLITKCGERLPYYFSGRRMPSAHGSKLVGMGVDISLRRTMEEKLRQSNRELEDFAYVASHDLQEPLRVVTGFAQLLSREYKGKLGEDADEFIGFVVDGAHRMQSMIRDLLEYSRVGTQGRPFEGVDLDQVADEALLNLQSRIEDAQATVTHDPLPTVMADRRQMVRLFQNLVGNAIKYHRPDVSPEIRLGARIEGGVWVFFVRDNGIGIGPKYFDRIFMMFQRLHGRDEYEGTGIGLAVCKKIVERHGGKIWLSSEIDIGTTFFFTLGGKQGDRFVT